MDVYNSTEGAWYLGKVLHFAAPPGEERPGQGQGQGQGEGASGSESRPGGAKGGEASGDEDKDGAGGEGVVGKSHFRIHYQGWPSK